MKIENLIAVVLGATGMTGLKLIEKLLLDERFIKIKVISRKPIYYSNNRIEPIYIENLEEIKSLDTRLKADIYFCCIGTTIKTAGSRAAFRKVDLDAVKSFAETAKINQAKSLVVVTAMGANSKSKVFYNQVKGEVEDFVLSLKIPNTVILRPSLLIGNRMETRVVESFIVQMVRTISKIAPNNWKKQMGTKVESLVECMIKEAITPNQEPKIIEAGRI